MRAYIVRRLGQMMPVLVAASVIVFMVIRWIPGDPATIYAGPNATPEVIAAVRHEFGLDQSLPQQYITWIRNLSHGNLGVSYVSQLQVSYLIGSALPNTVELATSALIFALVVGITLGVVAGLSPDSWQDRLVSVYNVVGLSVPGFWLGFILLLVFAVHLKVAPPGGHVGFSDDPVGAIGSLVLPAIALGMRFSAVVARFTRNAVIETLDEDFIRTAYAKGLGTLGMVRHDLLKNISLALITITGVEFGGLIAGAVVIETVFSWPGLGQLLIQSLGNRDYAVVQALLLLFVTVFLLVSLLADLCYSMLDPRIRVAGGQE